MTHTQTAMRWPAIAAGNESISWVDPWQIPIELLQIPESCNNNSGSTIPNNSTVVVAMVVLFPSLFQKTHTSTYNHIQAPLNLEPPATEVELCRSLQHFSCLPWIWAGRASRYRHPAPSVLGWLILVGWLTDHY